MDEPTIKPQKEKEEKEGSERSLTLTFIDDKCYTAVVTSNYHGARSISQSFAAYRAYNSKNRPRTIKGRES